MRMTNVQIKSFITVVNEKSFSKAASVLFVSQPSISRSIAKMEEELGFELLERKGGELLPTPAGERIYDYLVRSEEEFRSTVSEIRELLDVSGETIRIGCPDTWNPERFYDRIMTHFQGIHPDIRIEIEGNRVPDLTTRLQSGKLDFILTYELYRAVQNGFTVQRMTDIGCKLLYSKRYFPDIRGIEDLKGVPILVFDVDVEKKFGKFVTRAFSRYGFSPEIKYCSRLGSAIFDMSCGKGATLVTDWDNTVYAAPFGSVDVPYSATVNLVYRSDTAKPGIRALADELVWLFEEPNFRL